jgi:hypothetical protein
MVELVRAGHDTAKAERVVAGRCTIDVARVKITEAGRRALAGRQRDEEKALIYLPGSRPTMEVRTIA